MDRPRASKTAVGVYWGKLLEEDEAGVMNGSRNHYSRRVLYSSDVLGRLDRVLPGEERSYQRIVPSALPQQETFDKNFDNILRMTRRIMYASKGTDIAGMRGSNIFELTCRRQ